MEKQKGFSSMNTAFGPDGETGNIPLPAPPDFPTVEGRPACHINSAGHAPYYFWKGGELD